MDPSWLTFVEATQTHGPRIAAAVFLSTTFVTWLTNKLKPWRASSWAIVDAMWVISSVVAFTLACWSLSAEGPRIGARRALQFYDTIGMQLDVERRDYLTRYCNGGTDWVPLTDRCALLLRSAQRHLEIDRLTQGAINAPLPLLDGFSGRCIIPTDQDHREWARVCLLSQYLNQAASQLNQRLDGATAANWPDLALAFWVWVFPIAGGLRVNRSLRT